MQTVFEPALEHIVSLEPKYTNVDKSVFIWINYNTELEWCQQNCKGKYDTALIDDTVFLFAFEEHDESLIFNIKFKR